MEMVKPDKLSLININQGAAVNIFERCLDQIMANIKDPNTDAEAIRTVTLKIKFKPNADRTGVDAIIVPKVDLAGIKAHKGSAFIISEGGKAMAYPKDPRQEMLFDPNVKTSNA